MLSSHAASSNNIDAIHPANSTLSGISYASFQDSVCLNLKNSIFAKNPSNKTTHNEETWVLDTGATDHIIHSISLFTKITSSISSFVHLPNGEKVLATRIGTIQVTTSLILEDVICVPAFSFNLISVSKLTKSLSCCLVFLSNYCFVQDLTCWKMIGLGKLHNNLYLLQALSNYKSISEVSTVLELVLPSFAHSISHIPIVTKPHLSHLRLGHVSNAKLQHCISDVPFFHSNK